MAGKKRGMSLEDKRNTILDIFHESKSVFLLKDIEKLASKKGVVLQSIKEVLQSLVDDDLVHQEKIGISNYFWSFPSEAAVKLNTEANKLQERIKARTAEEAKLQEDLIKSRIGKEQSAERDTAAHRVDMLQQEVEAKKREMEQFSANDPERYEALKQASVVCRDSANRWTDNILTLRSWMKKKFSGMDGQIDSLFREQGVSDDLDYVE